MSKIKNFEKLLTANECEDLFTGFKNDRERLKYMSRAYKNIGIAKSFSIYYGLELDNSLKQSKTINTVTVIEVGNVYLGEVKLFDKHNLTFTIPGVKEEIIARDNFTDCIDNVNAYLATHGNKMLFEVREKKDNKYYVSVIQGYYRAWADKINKAIENKNGISVHIDELVKGGYIAHTNINELNELTGKVYTHSVFIPGSQIVLNIERDFDRWVGEDVIVVPQKFMDFKTLGYGANQLIERSLVSSRKLVLQIMGMKNMYEIYNDIMNKSKLAENNPNVTIEPIIFEGTVTGIINGVKTKGTFIELNDKYITGLLPFDDCLSTVYKVGDSVKVKIKTFEVQEGKSPFVLNKRGTSLIKCNVRPVFEIA